MIEIIALLLSIWVATLQTVDFFRKTHDKDE